MYNGVEPTSFEKTSNYLPPLETDTTEQHVFSEANNTIF